mmetsp:Transcript_49804/g.55536  ORF Transcript_49804/g.55536 Transcript_49804/m.55536 type:complete len:206 (-) Transcript_49804:165-782(-)|eukprot:CAMPEP_0170786204 /NCGR_PEP_ID=MMETSP0733-20121128/17436_1 /TAXON_ID=186038 /ORGANISM="Fragilariopsis kerguelensis, Strain L26-C5" /LENGTH=205 /DNA_ID=CAMNT_0011131951 /DNA_START=230 /DNA_END=847 /DNA_ORIENTATION=-
MTVTTTNNNKIDYTTIVDGKEEKNHWIRKSFLSITLLVCLGLYITTNNSTRFVNYVPVAATSSLVRSGGGAGVRDDVLTSSTAAFSTAAVVGTASSVGIVGDEKCCPTSKYYISITENDLLDSKPYFLCGEYYFTDQASRELAVTSITKENIARSKEGLQRLNFLRNRQCKERDNSFNTVVFGPDCDGSLFDNICYTQVYGEPLQ